MIKKILFSLSLIFILAFTANAQEEAKKHLIDIKPEAAIGNMTGLHSLHGSIFMAGQPDEATLRSLKKKGFEVVINIRGRDEVSFDEKSMAGLPYYNIPLLKEGRIQDAAVVQIHNALKENKGRKILLHCASGNRVAGWLGALMLRDLGYDIDTAVRRARAGGMTKDSMERILRNYAVSLK